MNPQLRQRIIDLIKNGQTLPKEDLYKLAAEEEDVFLPLDKKRKYLTEKLYTWGKCQDPSYYSSKYQCLVAMYL